MARGAIFEVDGTLVDSVDLHAQAWQDAFRMFGHDIDKQAIRSQISPLRPARRRAPLHPRSLRGVL
jgi:beta-phosphoglucomutase-like phosphatase (HAD superfamily)